MRYVFFIICCASILLHSLSFGIENTEQIIRQVEEGLLPAFVIKGQKLQKMSLADEMKKYRVPSLSIAVINNGKVEWAKAYGVKEADTNNTADSHGIRRQDESS